LVIDASQLITLVLVLKLKLLDLELGLDLELFFGVCVRLEGLGDSTAFGTEGLDGHCLVEL
ncbi:unnamed protein product, partial [Tilletia controversa]